MVHMNQRCVAYIRSPFFFPASLLRFPRYRIAQLNFWVICYEYIGYSKGAKHTTHSQSASVHSFYPLCFLPVLFCSVRFFCFLFFLPRLSLVTHWFHTRTNYDAPPSCDCRAFFLTYYGHCDPVLWIWLPGSLPVFSYFAVPRSLLGLCNNSVLVPFVERN